MQDLVKLFVFNVAIMLSRLAVVVIMAVAIVDVLVFLGMVPLLGAFLIFFLVMMLVTMSV